MANIRERLLASSVLLLGLGLFSPVYKQIYQQSLQAFQEHSSQTEAKKISKYRKYKSHRPCRRYLSSRSSFSRKLPTGFANSSQTGIAISPDGQELYQLTQDGIQITDRQTGEREYFDIPYSFPQLSWATDIAYDSRRDLVSLVSFGGEGYFYRFDAHQRRWLDVRSLHNLDLKSLTYDEQRDRYIAWAEDYGMDRGNLLFISGTGEILFQEQISDRMLGFDRLYDQANGMSPKVELFARGDSVALMVYDQNSVQYIWHYDLDSETVRLTYKSPERYPVLYSD